MRLSVVIATRGRPDLLLDTVHHTALHMANPSTRMLICVDDDDRATRDAMIKLPTDDRITVSVGPREDSRGEKYDRALKAAPADIYLPLPDYAPVLTPAFDQAISNEFWLWPDLIGIVCTPLVDQMIPGLQAMGSGLVSKLGHIYSHDYPFWFVDHEMMDLCDMLQRIAFVDVAVDVSRRPDKTMRLRDLQFWTLYYDAMTDERVAKALSIIDSVEFDDSQWRKARLRNCDPRIPLRSWVRHQGIRSQAADYEKERGIPGARPDEGYLRLYAKAKARLDGLVAEQSAA